MKLRTACLAALLVTACSTAVPKKTMQNETIFIGGTVAAGPQQTPQKNVAIVVSNGIVTEVGSAADVQRRHPGANVHALLDATILPGLTDAHGHLYGLGLSLDVVGLTETSSYDEVIARTAARAAKTPAGDWVLGRGWDQNDWPETSFPTAAKLDAAVADHPVWLKRVDGHAGLANSDAMRAAGITSATKDPEGGRILRDASGNPTGVFVDDAMALVEAKIPPPSYELRKRRVRAAAEEIARNGLVEMHDAGADDDTIRAIRELIDEHAFPIRVYTMLSDNGDSLANASGNNAPLLRWLARGPEIGYGARMTVRSIKVYADGALGSRGAALLAPYSDDPHNDGLVIAKPEHIAEIARRGFAAGFQVNTHAIGDRGVRNVVDAYESAGVTPKQRFRIEHLQITAPDDFARVARDGIIASMQPTHATSDMPWAEKRVGPQRIRGAYAWRTVLNSGARLALGSDFPVEHVNPFYGIYSAVTRQDHAGHPPGGWYPDQELTLGEALRGFTSDAAYAAFEEESRGTIEPGKLADFTIVEGDFFEMPKADLWKAKVLATVVDGDVVFEAK